MPCALFFWMISFLVLSILNLVIYILNILLFSKKFFNFFTFFFFAILSLNYQSFEIYVTKFRCMLFISLKAFSNIQSYPKKFQHLSPPLISHFALHTFFFAPLHSNSFMIHLRRSETTKKKTV